MAGIFARNGWKQYLICLLFLFSFGSSIVYGFERSPIYKGTRYIDSLDFYRGDLQTACEYLVYSQKDHYFPDTAAHTWEILNVFPELNITSYYYCMATVLRTSNYDGTTFTHDSIPGASISQITPVCNIGDPSGTATDETICTIPDNIPDPGANLGKPDCESSVSNPINAATGNKFAQETDIALASGLVFSRAYNTDSLSGSTQIGSNWRHNYQRGLFANPETVTTTRPDGRLIYFSLLGSTWVNQQASGDTLVQLVDINGDPAGWQFLINNNSTENYNINGKLLSIIDRNGRTQTLNYDANERLLSVSDDVGRTLSFTYDGSGRITTLTDPAVGLYQYAYDTDDNLASVTYPDTRVRTYHYNEPTYTSGADLPNVLTGITDENGIRYATYTYDTTGRAIVTEHAGGADRHMLAYDTGTDTTTITDPLGSIYTRQFQSILGVAKNISQSQPAGSGCSAASSATTYDMNGNADSRADFNGIKTCYAFDLNRNLEIARVEGFAAGSACPGDLVNYVPAVNTDERKTLTDWHLDFRLPVRVTETGRETTINYDNYGNATLLSIRDTASNETRTWNTSYVYHPTVPGVMTQRIEDGPRTDVNDITTIDYYAPDENCLGGHFGCRAQVMRVTNALGHVTDITRYNAHGQPEIIIDPNGLTTTLAYDNRQRLVSRVVGAEATDYQYDGVGQVTRITFPDNSFVAYTYDDAHRLTEITDSLSNAIRYTLDAAGNRTKEEVFDTGNALAQTRSQEFDALSRLWKSIGAQNQLTELAYDANGNLKQTTDPLLHTATNQFDALDRLIQANDPTGGQALQQLDALDQIAQVTDPKGIATSYTTNALGDVLQEVSADRGTITYTYDAAGNQLTKTDARGVVQTTIYDALNRPRSQSYTTVPGVPQIEGVNWDYDFGTNGIGRLTHMFDGSGYTAHQYDAHGRITNKTQHTNLISGNFAHTLSYQYNANGQLTRITYPSGAQIDYTYNTDGRPKELRINGAVLMQNIAYRPFGEPQSWNWGNGQAYSRSFDLDGRLIQHPLGTDTQTLTYDAASRITSTTHTNPVYNRIYQYDALDRLTLQANHNSTRLWGYDANSNRTSEQSGATVYPYTIDGTSNRLLSVAGPVAKTYTYDAAGNTLNDGTTAFTWNAAGRLVQTMISGNTTQYLHNANGERVNKSSSNTGQTLFLFGPGGQLIGDYQENQATPQNDDWLLQQETVWLGDIPVAVLKRASPTDPIQVYMIHADHLNTPRAIVNQTNIPVWRWSDNRAFGNYLPDEDPDGDSQLFEYNLRFAGQYFDSETRLHYNYFRDYDPETGRYISSDPIGLAGGLNTYGYALQNPLSFVDPYGLFNITNPANWPPLPTGLVNFFEGYGSYYSDVGKTATHLYRRSGIAGICLEQRAIRNEVALATVLLSLSDPTISRQAALATRDWANNNKSYLGGRLFAGGITSAVTGIGPYGGLSLATLAGMGNALDNIDRAGGALSAEQVLRSTLGDSMPNLSNFHQTECGCSK